MGRRAAGLRQVVRRRLAVPPRAALPRAAPIPVDPVVAQQQAAPPQAAPIPVDRVAVQQAVAPMQAQGGPPQAAVTIPAGAIPEARGALVWIPKATSPAAKAAA